MILRPYQAAASDAIFKEWQKNNATLVVMPTGGGKTILFADVIRRVFPRRALVIAHREELIFQARDKIQRVTGLISEHRWNTCVTKEDKDFRTDHTQERTANGGRREAWGGLKGVVIAV